MAESVVLWSIIKQYTTRRALNIASVFEQGIIIDPAGPLVTYLWVILKCRVWFGFIIYL